MAGYNGRLGIAQVSLQLMCLAGQGYEVKIDFEYDKGYTYRCAHPEDARRRPKAAPFQTPVKTKETRLIIQSRTSRCPGISIAKLQERKEIDHG